MSQKPSGFDRVSGDKYYTPAWVTEALRQVEYFTGLVWDPCAGAGHIVDVFDEAIGSDLEPGRPDIITRDFFEFSPGELAVQHIVSNLPYGTGGRLAVKMIRHALAHTERSGGKMAMLLRVDFDSANGRRELFAEHPAFAAKYALTRRIHWANLPVKLDQYGRPVHPTENHAWYVWDWQKRRDAARTYGYLPYPAKETTDAA